MKALRDGSSLSLPVAALICQVRSDFLFTFSLLIIVPRCFLLSLSVCICGWAPYKPTHRGLPLIKCVGRPILCFSLQDYISITITVVIIVFCETMTENPLLCGSVSTSRAFWNFHIHAHTYTRICICSSLSTEDYV